jgi:hypothetical protein
MLYKQRVCICVLRMKIVVTHFYLTKKKSKKIQENTHEESLKDCPS